METNIPTPIWQGRVHVNLLKGTKILATQLHKDISTKSAATYLELTSWWVGSFNSFERDMWRNDLHKRIELVACHTQFQENFIFDE